MSTVLTFSVGVGLKKMFKPRSVDKIKCLLALITFDDDGE